MAITPGGQPVSFTVSDKRARFGGVKNAGVQIRSRDNPQIIWSETVTNGLGIAVGALAQVGWNHVTVVPPPPYTDIEFDDLGAIQQRPINLTGPASSQFAGPVFFLQLGVSEIFLTPAAGAKIGMLMRDAKNLPITGVSVSLQSLDGLVFGTQSSDLGGLVQFDYPLQNYNGEDNLVLSVDGIGDLEVDPVSTQSGPIITTFQV